MNTNQLAAAFSRHGISRAAVLASTFRSGSTWIAELLERNGVPGLDKERFNGAWDASEGYLDGIVSEFTHGYFATKLMWPHRNDLARLLGMGRGASASFAKSFPDATWLFIRRRDLFRQAVSFYRAKKSGRWHVYGVGAQEPSVRYSFTGIDACMRELVLHDQLWMDFFAIAGVPFFSLYYEDVLADQTLLCPYLNTYGLELKHTGRTNLRRQSDDLTEKFLTRYLDQLYRKAN